MQVNRNSNLEIPASLKDKLLAFRRRVWMLKMVEAISGATIGILIGFLLTYLLDRFFDTSPLMRGLILLGSALTCGLIPIAINQLDHQTKAPRPTRPFTIRDATFSWRPVTGSHRTFGRHLRTVTFTRTCKSSHQASGSLS